MRLFVTADGQPVHGSAMVGGPVYLFNVKRGWVGAWLYPGCTLSPHSEKNGIAGLLPKLKLMLQLLGLDFIVRLFEVLKSPLPVRRLNLQRPDPAFSVLFSECVSLAVSWGISGLGTGREGARA